MGQELECRMQYEQAVVRREGLSGDRPHSLPRARERVKIALKDLTAVSAKGGVLTLEFPGGPARLRVGRGGRKVGAKDSPSADTRRQTGRQAGPRGAARG